MKIKVTVTLKNGVLDPQGKAIQQTLNGMGFPNVEEVRQGKYFEVEVNERDRLSSKSYKTASQLKKVSDGSVVEVVGLVISRQRPQTAAGIIFVTLEDESGLVNLIVWPSVTDAFEDILNSAKILSVIGKVQKEGLVINIVAQKLSDYTAEIGELDASSRDFK